MGGRFILLEPIQKQPFLDLEYLKIVKFPSVPLTAKIMLTNFVKTCL